MHPEIEQLIDLALADGQITEKEREIIHRKGSELNFNLKDIELFIDEKIKSVTQISKGETIGLTLEKKIFDDTYELVDVNIRVAESDFEPMSFLEATEACHSLGEGWRLPTKIELKAMFDEKKILDIDEVPYWSSSLNKNNHIWILDFENDEFELSTGSDYRLKSRAVMSR
jgi:hypothetical protein